MFATIIAGVLALAGTVISAGVQSSTAKDVQKKQDAAWREQMAIEEKQRKRDNMARGMQMFQDTINRSEFYKQQVGKLWSGRRAG